MPVTRTRTVVLIGASFSLAVMSFAGGVTIERIRFDRERGEVVAHESFAGSDALPEVR